jgi:uncharacterized repeat protein (TIGR01451 family)
MEHKILSNSLVLAVAIMLSLSLSAPFKVYGQYSSDQNKKEISIDKKVRSIDESEYYDNIEASKKTFFQNDVVEFQIKVQNTGDQNLNNVDVKDLLPKHLGLIFYPGDFDKDNNKIEWKIDTLVPGESRVYLIRAKIQDTNDINTLTQQTNTAQVSVDDLNDTDNASYFIGKANVPDTGASDIVIKTLLVTLIATSGFYFRKIARGY